jgi:GTPase SAR1 family protein
MCDFFHLAKSTIPGQILQMNEKDKEMYLDIIKSGTERRYYIRLMIIGENGVGKTCLMRRLLEEDIDEVTCADGIDVVISKSKIRHSDGKWILNEGIFHIQYDSICFVFIFGKYNFSSL